MRRTRQRCTGSSDAPPPPPPHVPNGAGATSRAGGCDPCGALSTVVVARRGWRGGGVARDGRSAANRPDSHPLPPGPSGDSIAHHPDGHEEERPAVTSLLPAAARRKTGGHRHATMVGGGEAAHPVLVRGADGAVSGGGLRATGISVRSRHAWDVTLPLSHAWIARSEWVVVVVWPMIGHIKYKPDCFFSKSGWVPRTSINVFQGPSQFKLLSRKFISENDILYFAAAFVCCVPACISAVHGPRRRACP